MSELPEVKINAAIASSVIELARLYDIERSKGVDDLYADLRDERRIF